MQDDAQPRVLAVLVAHDGAEWLPRALDGLASQRYRELEVVAVDNGSTDASRQILIDRLGPDRLLVADRDLGFGAAVSMALDSGAADGADYLLLLHDDIALHPRAVPELVEALDHDPRLAMVGPKLRDWDRPDRLQSVGWTVDLTGRADSGIDEGELDQGQRDGDRRCLYVSTAAMLVRKDAFEELGRFDRRYHAFRDDLDLCWRAWLSGRDVEVIPAAVGEHVAGAATYRRLGQTRFLGPRYFAERNTLATLLKNYGAARLALVVPLFFAVGIAKVLGFLLTRRFSDAWQTVRAWLWNVLHLRENLRLRRGVQRTRRRTDAELKPLFGQIAPRLRAYAEAIGDWIAGGDVDPVPVSSAQATRAGEPETLLRRVRRLAAQRPVLVAGALLTVLVLVGAIPVLGPGLLRGGELAPWPGSPGAFLGDYVASWHEAGAFGTADSPSPAQALLGLLHVAVLGNEWLAPRLLLLGSLLVGWLLALRAAQSYSRRRPARVAAATAFVLSPPTLAALGSGRIGALVVLAALPGILAGGVVAVRRSSSATAAWRAVAAIVLLGAVAGAFEPVVLPVLTVAAVLTVAVRAFAAPERAWRRAMLLRGVVVALGAWALLLPWSATLLAPDGPLLRMTGPVLDAPLWRWMLLAPESTGWLMPAVGAGFVLGGLLGMALALRGDPVRALGLWLTALAAGAAGWLAARHGLLAWPPLPLLISALAYAGLLGIAFARAEGVLARHEFGWRHLSVAAVGTVVALAVGATAVDLVQGPWEGFETGEEPLPSFVTTAADEQPFRAVMLTDEGDAISWEVVDGAGPTMAAYGVQEPAVAVEAVGEALTAAMAGADPSAAGRLGAMNVRYVVVPEEGVSERLDDVLREQVALEPQPVAEGRVFEVSGWLPRAGLVSSQVASAVVARGDPGVEPEADPMLPTADGYVAQAVLPTTALLAETADEGWRVEADGRPVPLEAAGPVPGVLAEIEEGNARVTIVHDGGPARGLWVAWQVVALLLTVSLALRPPSAARRLRADDAEVG